MGSYATIHRDDLGWVSGESLLGKFEQNESSTRMFRTKCGSFIAGTHALAADMIFCLWVVLTTMKA
ncbi:MAG: hypothetical protein ACJA2E_000179 [Arenicella sp.]|jgi:hypothetical protein